MALLPLVLLSAARAATFTWDPVVDTSVTLGTGLTFVLLEYVVEPTLPAGTIRQGSVPGIDEVALDRWNPQVALASDALLYGTLGAGVVASAIGGRVHDDGWVPLGLELESLAVAGTAISMVKLAVRRPRPFTWMDDPPEDALEKLEDVDATLSFPSGHTGMTATASFCAASLLSREGAPSLPLYGGAAVLTATVASFRVIAGRHYPTDVLAGAAIGTAVGLSVPALHATSSRAAAWVSPGAGDEAPPIVGFRGTW